MSKGAQTALIALAAAFLLLIGFAAVLLGKEVLTPSQPASIIGTGTEEEAAVNTIQVTANGTVRVEPDIAYITLGVQSQAKTAEDAQESNMEKMTALYQVLAQMGIAEKDYYTSQYNVSPNYTYSGSTQKITGYTTTNMIEVTLRDLDQIGALLDAAAKAGMNQAYSLQFGLENPDTAGLDALETALTNADAKAKLMATVTGVEIVRVLSIRDSAVNTVIPYDDAYRSYKAAAEADMASVPISSGTIEVTVQASVVYEIK